MGPTAADQSWQIRLALCLRRIEEACTIENGLACHNEVLDLLAGQILSVHLTSWPQAVKDMIIVALQRDIERYQERADRLSYIIESGSQFIWAGGVGGGDQTPRTER
jgi:hypothetical protein